jgi:hypothetical protein
MPNFFSCSLRFFVLAIVPSNRSQKPETIRHTIAIDVRPDMANHIPLTALATPIYVKITV